MGEHAKYGGSTIKRTLECPAWVGFCEPLPKQGSSEFADRGTLLHNAMEKIYEADEDFDPRTVIGSTYEGIVLTAELYDEKIIPAIAAVEAIFDRFEVEDFQCEARVTIAENIWGTADLLASGRMLLPPDDLGEEAHDPDDLGGGDGAAEYAKVGICIDYKFGDGILVTAFENAQGLFYSLAASMTPETKDFFEDIDILIIGIIQPNERGDDDFSLWEVDPARLEQMRVEILAAVDQAEGKDPRFKSGDHCNFCGGRGLCPPTSGEVSAMMRIDVTAPDLIEKIPTFKQLELAEKTINALRAFVHQQIEEGVPIPGFKLVPKRASRVYTDEAIVRGIVKRSRKIKREEAYTDKLKSPTQMEKLCKAKSLDFADLFGAYVAKVSSGTTLADEDDPRESPPGLGALAGLLARD